eukprot:jgi/Tetstr1/465870/TSEL_010487.t1
MAYDAAVPSKRPSAVREGDWVVWDVNGDKSSFVQALANGKVKMSKSTVSLQPVVGVPFGTQFTLNQAAEELEVLSGRSLLEETTRETVTEKNNSCLLDDGTNQTLTQEQLDGLKDSAKGGAEIVAAICSGSKSFEEKTVFSQEKYRKKKAKKYAAVATVRRPTAAAVADSYFRRCPTKICGMRPDTLAVMLTLANVGPHQEVLVLDMAAGLLAAAVTERLGGMGHCCSVHPGQKQGSMDALRFFNFSPEVKAATTAASLTSLEAAFSKVTDAAQGGGAKGDEATEEAAAAGEAGPAAEAEGAKGAGDGTEEVPPAEAEAEVEAEGGAPREAEGGQQQRRASAWESTPARLEAWAAGGGFTSCLVAAPSLQPIAVLERLLPLLAPSAPFAIFSNSPLPLALAMTKLRKTGAALGVQLTENWHREYQVLPARTHPTMSTSGTGGYVLSGTKVATQQRPVAAEDQVGKKPRTEEAAAAQE